MTRLSVTRKQAELLAFIKDYLSENDGVAPSFDEMRQAMRIVSKSGIFNLLAALEARGMIRRPHNKARAIEVVENSLANVPTEKLVAELHRRRAMAEQGLAA